MTHGPTANDETRERCAECPGCGSRMTHLHTEGWLNPWGQVSEIRTAPDSR